MKSTRLTYAILSLFLLIQLSCSKSDTKPVTQAPSGGSSAACATATPGSLFKEVKNLITNNCVTCHNPNGQMPTVNFQDNCVIQSRAALIKQRAVDQGNMPPTGSLSQNDKDKITTWVAAGGRVTD
jgi:uncharacterized membrane protein